MQLVILVEDHGEKGDPCYEVTHFNNWSELFHDWTDAAYLDDAPNTMPDSIECVIDMKADGSVERVMCEDVQEIFHKHCREAKAEERDWHKERESLMWRHAGC